MLTAQKH